MVFARTNTRAFTLVELLTVISLIASLAALLFPVFGQARGKARRSVCLSNVRQIGMAVEMYCEDYDGIYPYAVDPDDKYDPNGWAGHPEFAQAIPFLPLLSEALQPYVRSHEVFHCPADTGLNELDTTTYALIAAPSAYQKLGMSYLYHTLLTVDHLSEGAASAADTNRTLL